MSEPLQAVEEHPGHGADLPWVHTHSHRRRRDGRPRPDRLFLCPGVPDGGGAHISAGSVAPSRHCSLPQFGYEPIPEQVSKNIFGQRGYRRASFITYCKHIYLQAGIRGLFLGWQPRVVETILDKVAREATGRFLWPRFGPAEEHVQDPTKEQAVSAKLILHEIALDTLCGAAGVIVSHPFYEHVGHEGIYTTLIGSITHIYAKEGFAGFYSGIVPALLQETAYVLSITFFGHLFKNLIMPYAKDVATEQKRLFQFLSHSLALAVSNPIFFPFKTVKTLMAVNHTDLAVGRLPYAPTFPSWVDCFSYLYELNGFGNRGLLRGSSILRRFYGKPLKH